MLNFQTPRRSSATSVSSISLCSGKSCMPYVSAENGTVAYVNSFTTNGQVSRLTIISRLPKITEDESFSVRVVDRIDAENLETVYYDLCTSFQAIEHCLGDLQSGNHRLYSAESVSLRSRDPHMASEGFAGKSGNVEFTDGIAKLLSALEWLTGEDCNSKFSPVSKKLGCSSNMPTLEKVVFGQAARHVRVRRPSGSKSFTAGMPTTESGGAKLPSVKEQIQQHRNNASANLEQAEKAFEAGNSDEAERRFTFATESESKAIELQNSVNDRMTLLRERAARARASRKEALAQAEIDAQLAEHNAA